MNRRASLFVSDEHGKFRPVDHKAIPSLRSMAGAGMPFIYRSLYLPGGLLIANCRQRDIEGHMRMLRPAPFPACENTVFLDVESFLAVGRRSEQWILTKSSKAESFLG